MTVLLGKANFIGLSVKILSDWLLSLPHEADPDAELYYNDFSMAKNEKREGVIKMVRNLQSQGVKIDGIGMQGHMTMDFPAIEDFEESLLAFADLGVKVMITEFDLSALPSLKKEMSGPTFLWIIRTIKV